MEKAPRSPGVVLPPPIIYLTIFLASLLLQWLLPINKGFFSTPTACILSGLFFLGFIFFAVRALIVFFRSKNTVNTTKAATSLQTGGIYAVSRNPMYMGLVCLYAGIALLLGNWWTFILLPVLVFIMQTYVIRREEKYLTHAFGNEYLEYKKRVRRWI